MGCNTFNLNDLDHVDSCFAVDIGKDYSREFSESIDGVATVYTGFTFNFIVKDIKGGVTLLSLSNTVDRTVSGIYITPTANEVLELIIDATDSATLSDGTYVYEMTVTNTLPTTEVFMEGTIRFKEANI